MDDVRWRMVVLDDDPTGIQTVHGCQLVTQWDEESIRRAMADEMPFFYVLTNTRAMTRQEAAAVTREAMETVVRVNRDLGYRLIIVSRSDSCLRGHFPLETDVMREVLMRNGYAVAEKTPFCPAFIEAGRITVDGIHYMKDGDRLIPVSETEFARDNVFAYHTSVLTEYICEKGANPDSYEIIDAQGYEQLQKAAGTIVRSLATCDAVVVRSSSSLPKAIANCPDIDLLDKSILSPLTSQYPPLFIVGSHVKKTTRQLECLLAEPGTCGMELDVQRILDDSESMMQDVLATMQQIVDEHLTPVVYTSRQEIRCDDADRRQHLGRQVSDFLVDIVRRMPYTPSYLVAKGGITSHDILTRGLGIKSARVLGQVVTSVPCVMTEQFPYIIFPGNVGDEGSLRDVYIKLKG